MYRGGGFGALSAFAVTAHSPCACLLPQIESMVRTADVDSSNTIDFGEFQQMYAKLAGC